MILGLTSFAVGAAIFLWQEGGIVLHFDPTISLATIIQLPILAGIGYIIRFISIQKDFPPHRHVRTNGHTVIIYPDGYTPDAPEKSQGASA